MSALSLASSSSSVSSLRRESAARGWELCALLIGVTGSGAGSRHGALQSNVPDPSPALSCL